MRTLALLTVPAVLAAACTATEPHGQEAAAPGARAARVVLLSLDGLASVRHRANLRASLYTEEDGLRAFERGGFVVERAVPVDPPLTSPSHTSIATGAFPAATGIVANAFHVPGTAIGERVSGFDYPWSAEPLWQAFRRQGKRVGVLTFPGCDATAPSRTADFGMTYVNTPNAPAATVTLTADRFAAATLPSGWRSYSPPRRTTLSVPIAGAGAPSAATFTLTAIDGTDDGVTDYDALIADDDGDPGNGVLATVRTGEWFALRIRVAHPDGGARTVGAWCLLQALPRDLAGVKIYRGAFFSTEAYPRAFRERLEAAAGFWPGPGDERAVAQARAGRDGLTLAEYMAQERRFSEFFSTCARVAVGSERFDLLMLYQPVVDEVEHALLVTDPRQEEYSEPFAATARSAVDEVYRIADHAVAELARVLDLARDAVVVVSDHGMAPVWEGVSVNQILQAAGLADAEETETGWRVKGSSRMVAFGSGGCLNLYVNLQGREPAGVVAPAEESEVVQAAAVALAQAQVDGEDVVESMYRREQLSRIGMDSPNAGDLVVFLQPGFAGDSRITQPGEPFHAPARLAGQHGFANTHPEMGAVWLARGAGVAPRHLGTASLTGVAAFVARLAGAEPPLQARPWTP